MKALLHAKGYTAGFSKCGVVLHVAAFDKRMYATYRAFCKVYDILLSKVTDANGPARQVVTYRGMVGAMCAFRHVGHVAQSVGT